jgi:hypothetical protein
MLISLSRLTPLSSPAMTDTSAMAMIPAINDTLVVPDGGTPNK